MKKIKLLSFLSIISCTHPSVKPSQELKIIDAHMHARFQGGIQKSSKIPLTKEQFLLDMKQTNVVGGVVHTGQDGSDYVDLSDHNIISCYGLSQNFSVIKLEDGLKSKKFKCIKVYLGYVYKYANDPHYMKAYKLAEKYNVPVVFHTGDTYSKDGKLKYSEPMLIDDVAVEFRKVNFVIAHIGNPWIQTAAEIAYKNPNVYLEASALMIGNLSRLSEEEVEQLIIQPIRWTFLFLEDPEKIMFGSDYPLTSISDYAEIFKKAIPQEHWQAVFHDNAVNVFGLKP